MGGRPPFPSPGPRTRQPCRSVSITASAPRALVCSRYQVEPCGSPAWYRASLMNGRGFARIDGEGVLPSGEDWYITVTFPTPPEHECRGVHVLGYVTRTSGRRTRAIQVVREKGLRRVLEEPARSRRWRRETEITPW